MEEEKMIVQDASEVDPNLLRMLNRGLEDMTNSVFLMFLNC